MTEVMFSGETHWFADQYKPLTAEELDQMRDSLTSEGLIDPITLDPRGVLLDGRHRVKLCEELGIQARFRVHEGDPVAFIIAVNSTGRQESAGERSMAVAWQMWEAGLWNGQTDRWRQGASEQVLADAKTSNDSDLARCGTILAHDLDVARAVMLAEEGPLGTKGLRATYDEVKKLQRKQADKERAEKAEQERRDKEHAEMEKHFPDILEQITATFTHDMAYAAYQERDKKRIKAEEDAKEMVRKTSESIASGIWRLSQYDLNEDKRGQLIDLDLNILGDDYATLANAERAINTINLVIDNHLRSN